MRTSARSCSCARSCTPWQSEDMPAAGAIIGHEVEVPSGDVDCSRIERRPEPDGGTADVGERKLRLMCGRFD